jgi:nucleoside-diphosphate-sugar epimerase
MSRKILVTGGAGYLGTTLVPKLVSLGYDVTVVDNLLFKQQVFLELCQFTNFRFVKGDVRNTKLMKELIADKDIIIPLAALVGAPLCAMNEQSTIEINKN